MNKLEIEKRLEELEDCKYIVIHHYIGVYVYETFLYKSIENFPEYEYLKCSIGDRTIKYNSIKSILPKL